MDKQSPPNTTITFREYRLTKELKEYIVQKTQMSETAFADIEWQSHERSINTFKDGPHIFLVKFLNSWLPVGKVRYDPIKYPSVSQSCYEPIEDFEHFLTCPNPERCIWHAALKTSNRNRCESLNTDPALLDLLLWGAEPLAPRYANPSPQSTRADRPSTP
ncbi:hypothetical protein IV203_011924 [Nitzschia inconspicua]|uniref:Uncharacterized protein n=1 Tax=Nitzschia inconspicua TaxID=303405 RepID=A0A9K3KTL0_9STRA|nr:hypothetical protein IV203_011924 [Nitzschia inconspicua]